MNRISTKKTAEAVLRELPSVMGAYVSEDMEGRPREIHLLVTDGPDTASFARDVRSLLEERLGMPIDQRVISIAQLADEPPRERPTARPTDREAGRQGGAGTPQEPITDAEASRPVFAGLESSTSSGHVTVAIRLEWEGEQSEGTAAAVDTQTGRARAAAAATLQSAADARWNGGLKFELDFASIVQALDGEYVLVSVLGMSARLGRRPLPLVGAHAVESDVETASALATLKAINRVLALALKRA